MKRKYIVRLVEEIFHDVPVEIEVAGPYNDAARDMAFDMAYEQAMELMYNTEDSDTRWRVASGIELASVPDAFEEITDEDEDEALNREMKTAPHDMDDKYG